MNINKILRDNPRPCTYGAPMGARDICQSEAPLHLQRVAFVDGAYLPDGTYYGMGLPIYCAFNGADCPEYAPGMGTRIYVRAKSRAAAMAQIMEDYDVKFKRATA